MLRSGYFLEKYGVSIADCDTNEEKLQKLANAFGLYESYEGSKPFIFISYAHKDAQLVMPAIKEIQEKGYPVWFDAGIRIGDEWAADIARHLKKCKLVIAFASKNYFASPNCRAEVVYAFSNQKQMLTVRLDNAPLPEGLDMYLSLSQMFDGFTYDDGDEFVKRLANLPFLKQQVPPSLVSEIQEKKRKAKKAALAKQEEERRRVEAEAAAEKRRELEARRKAEAEATARRKLEEEKAQRLLEQENRERIRQEEALAEEARKRRERENRERRQQEKIREQREQSKKNIDAAAKKITSLLKECNHEKAIETYHTEICEIAKGDEQLVAYAMPYYEQLCEKIYQEAERFEAVKVRNTRDYARKLFGALPTNYRDAGERWLRLYRKYAAREKRYSWFACLLFLALNVFLSYWVLHLVDSWMLKLLLMQAPVAMVIASAHFGAKRLGVNCGEYVSVTLFLHLVTLIANACLFQGIGVGRRILWTLVFTVVSALINFVVIICDETITRHVSFGVKITAPSVEK